MNTTVVLKINYKPSNILNNLEPDEIIGVKLSENLEEGCVCENDVISQTLTLHMSDEGISVLEGSQLRDLSSEDTIYHRNFELNFKIVESSPFQQDVNVLHHSHEYWMPTDIVEKREDINRGYSNSVSDLLCSVQDKERLDWHSDEEQPTSSIKAKKMKSPLIVKRDNQLPSYPWIDNLHADRISHPILRKVANTDQVSLYIYDDMKLDKQKAHCYDLNNELLNQTVVSNSASLSKWRFTRFKFKEMIKKLVGE